MHCTLPGRMGLFTISAAMIMAATTLGNFSAKASDAPTTKTLETATLPEGDQLPIKFFPVTTSLNETFTDLTPNVPVKIENWLNVAESGTRAWRGHKFEDGNTAAMANAYDAAVTSDGTESIMTLITPGLTYYDARSRIFSFRVMGENLTDNMTDSLQLIYFGPTLSPAEHQEFPIEGVEFPRTAADNGKWISLTVDLWAIELDAEFAIGFRFKGTVDKTHKATYYIDDVTFGQTNIPFMRPMQYNVELTTNAGKSASTVLQVLGYALTDDIEATLVSETPEVFSLGATSVLPAGGRFPITFRSETAGTYEADVIFTSEDAQDTKIHISVENKAVSSIEDLPNDQSEFAIVVEGTTLSVAAPEAIRAIALYGTDGKLLTRVNPDYATAQLPMVDLPAGVIIATVTTDSTVRTVKVVR